MRGKTHSKEFIKKEFPELLNYKILTSRLYEKKEKPGFRDNWWINFSYDDLQESEYIVFAGALDSANENFKIFKVPSSYIKSNIDNISMTERGWINIYLHFTDFVDVRGKKSLSFKEFVLN